MSSVVGDLRDMAIGSSLRSAGYEPISEAMSFSEMRPGTWGWAFAPDLVFDREGSPFLKAGTSVEVSIPFGAPRIIVAKGTDGTVLVAATGYNYQWTAKDADGPSEHSQGNADFHTVVNGYVSDGQALSAPTEYLDFPLSALAEGDVWTVETVNGLNQDTLGRAFLRSSLRRVAFEDSMTVRRLATGGFRVELPEGFTSYDFSRSGDGVAAAQRGDRQFAGRVEQLSIGGAEQKVQQTPLGPVATVGKQFWSGMGK